MAALLLLALLYGLFLLASLALAVLVTIGVAVMLFIRRTRRVAAVTAAGALLGAAGGAALCFVFTLLVEERESATPLWLYVQGIVIGFGWTGAAVGTLYGGVSIVIALVRRLLALRRGDAAAPRLS